MERLVIDDWDSMSSEHQIVVRQFLESCPIHFRIELVKTLDEYNVGD